MPRVKEQKQSKMGEEIIHDDVILDMLVNREKLAEDARIARVKFNKVNDELKGKPQFNAEAFKRDEDGNVIPKRYGRFLVDGKVIEGRTVESFETKDRFQLSFKAIEATEDKPASAPAKAKPGRKPRGKK